MTWTLTDNALRAISEDGLFHYAVYYTPLGWQAARIDHTLEDGMILEGRWAESVDAQKAAEALEAERIENSETEGDLYQAVVFTEDAMDAAYQTFKVTPPTENYQSLLGDLADFQAARLAYQKAVGR